MSQSIQVNGQTISYPETGDSNWGDNATNFAIQTSSAFGKLGLDSGTSVDIPQTLDVTGNTTLDANLSVAGTTNLTGNVTVGGVIYADDSTTANTPVISFTGDTNTGIGRSAADTLDLITNGNSRFRIESTGQIKAVYESQVGTDYNTQLDNGYLCRAWVNFNGTLVAASMIRASGNVSSITDNNTGDYTINFTTALPDANYSALVNVGALSTGSWGMPTTVLLAAKSTSNFIGLYSTTQMSLIILRQTSYSDENLITVGIFR